MAVFCVEVATRTEDGAFASERSLVARLTEAGLAGVREAARVRLFFLEGDLRRPDVERVAAGLLADAVTEVACVRDADHPHRPLGDAVEFEIHPRPGVMDPVAGSTLAELCEEGLPVAKVRTASRYIVRGEVAAADVLATALRVLANDCVEELVPGTAGVRPAASPPLRPFALRHIAIRGLDDSGLEGLSRGGHLFLSLAEMRSIQAHFRALGRDPTDLELETIAQTWSEHCGHKTLRSAFVYRGMPWPGAARSDRQIEVRFGNLLRDTIARATRELMAEGRGPKCLSVFADNAGIIAFDERFGIAFKVETHNHPSAIEPYGGAATGTGGCIRDILGCGLGARPVANTDVFCVAPSDWPLDSLPKGVLHPRRVLRGIVRGVADYGNRMGIPTVNGAVYFDPRYLGNPLVYCGCVGLIPRDRIDKGARAGDLIVLVGGRTGRDGIHGATFSSAELTDAHAEEFSHAVQIGNAIEEKRILDALLKARDDACGCLYAAITDCGAGGLSSAVGEMGEAVGASVDLERVSLKYAGLRYDEIWISEAQERMVAAVPREHLDRFLEIMRAETVEATVIGEFGPGSSGPGKTWGQEMEGTSEQVGPTPAPRLTVRFQGQVVGELDMSFLHEGLPTQERVAEWRAASSGDNPTGHRSEHGGRRQEQGSGADDSLSSRLLEQLSRPVVAGKEWIIRQYDHEVQGGSVVKPLIGRGQGPADAAVLRPRLDSARGIAVGCGLAPHLSDVDPYWMAVASIDEALRNVVCVGGDPRQTALLDNFCWGRSDDCQQLGALVRTCQACYDAAKAFGTPFISGKDSLNNEFALDEADIEPLLAALRRAAQAAGPDADRIRHNLSAWERRVRETRRLAIPGTLLISAVSLISDVRRCITSDLKTPGDALLRVGGLPATGFALHCAAEIHLAVADALSAGLISACHDASDGGWLTAVAEMAIAGWRGVKVDNDLNGAIAPFEECCAGYVVETDRPAALAELCAARGVATAPLGMVTGDEALTIGGVDLPVGRLRASWVSPA